MSAAIVPGAGNEPVQGRGKTPLRDGCNEGEGNDDQGRDQRERRNPEVEAGAAEQEQSGADSAAEAARGAMPGHLAEAGPWAQEDLIEVIVKTSGAHRAEKSQYPQRPEKCGRPQDKAQSSEASAGKRRPWIIEDDAFIGSDTQLVAPVTVGKGATIGAGLTITKDTPAGELTLSRSKQMTIAGWQRPQKGKK